MKRNNVIINEIECRIILLENIISEYNKIISKYRLEKKYDLCEKYADYRNDIMIELDMLKDMIRIADKYLK